jgi:hypothetical protein
MFTAILTWAGAMLGITVLLLMAFGPVAIDFDSARTRHWLRRHRDEQEKPAPLG